MVHQAGWLTLVCLLATPNNDSTTSFALSGSCDGQQITLRLEAQDYGEKPEVVGFYIDRRPIATSCGDFERVTPEPIPRQERAEYVISFQDEKVEQGLAYEYTLVGVDAQSREHTLPTATPTWVGCGDAPVAHGYVESAGWSLVVKPACSVHCNPSGPIAEWPADIDAWVGRRIPVMLYGSVSWSETSGATIAVSDWALENCSVDIAETPWGLLKQLYR